MKKAKTIIDTDMDTITFLDKRINMISTESGHCLMEVQNWTKEYDHEENAESMALVSELDNMDNNNNKWKVIPSPGKNGQVPKGQRFAAVDTADMETETMTLALNLTTKVKFLESRWLPMSTAGLEDSDLLQWIQLILQTETMTLTSNHMQTQLIQMQPLDQPVQEQIAMHKMHFQLFMNPLNKLLGTFKETLMQMRIPRPTTWKPPTVPTLSRMLNIKATVQTNSMICQDRS